ncbi:uncharacterized protein JCM15063_004143 [Sporobolomyces koalae]|uniref:uncharacterized protein n=1 Tax=Sporobolomyces koalae TaxID=500713 RepID=UPI0031778E3A
MSRSVDFLSPASASTGPLASGSRSNVLPPATSILITDTLASPSLFLVTQLVARTLRKSVPIDLKGKGKGKVVLVGIREVESEYTNILKKQSVQLTSEKTLGNFRYIDGSSGDLVQLYALVRETVDALRTEEEEGTLVILDDVSALSWIGNDLEKINKFHLALRNLCITTRSTLVSVLHADSISPHPVIEDESDQYLFRKILQSSDYWFELKSLVAQARGELSIQPGPALALSQDQEGIRTRTGKDALEYRLEENGAVFEVKGLGKFI